MKVDAVIPLAVGMHSNPGAYAVLIASGVSASAGMPTGWDVMMDLIRKVASLQRDDAGGDPEAWYKAKFGVAPDYSVIMDALAKTPAERSGLLRGYLHATPDDREEGKKTPTKAHRAIARLVAKGYVRVIITTNFDRLMEEALNAEGVTFTYVRNAADVDAARPIIHNKCTVVKVHGDYQDDSTKNTPAELEAYDEKLKDYLARVFKEFGCIACGWSAEWDAALRQALVDTGEKAHFSTYWASRSDPQGKAKEVTDARRATWIQIADADSLFEDLEGRVLALESMTGTGGTLSSRTAMETVKRYLPEAKHYIRLRDAIHDETSKAIQGLDAAVAAMNAADGPTIQKAVESIDRTFAPLATMAATWGAFSRQSAHPDPDDWIAALGRIHNAAQRYTNSKRAVATYAHSLIVYSLLLGAKKGNQPELFARILKGPDLSVDGKGVPPIVALSIEHIDTVRNFSAVDAWAPKMNAIQHFMLGRAPAVHVSVHLQEALRPVLRPMIADDAEYMKAFEDLEYFLGIASLDANSRFFGKPLDETPMVFIGSYVAQATLTLDERGPRERMQARLTDAHFIAQHLDVFDGDAARLTNALLALNNLLDKFY